MWKISSTTSVPAQNLLLIPKNSCPDDKVKTVFDRKNDELNPTHTDSIQQSPKRRKTSFESTCTHSFKDYFRKNPEALFDHADAIKSNLKTKQISIPQILPVFGAAAENLIEKKTPVLSPPSIVVEKPNSIYRLFRTELDEFVNSDDWSTPDPDFIALIKQDKISSDTCLFNEPSSSNPPQRLIETIEMISKLEELIF